MIVKIWCFLIELYIYEMQIRENYVFSRYQDIILTSVDLSSKMFSDINLRRNVY